jgi:Big-like domain-containing protein
MTLSRTIIVVGVLALGVGSCDRPFTQPACYSGPGCGSDDVPPVGEVVSPSAGATVNGNYWLAVNATDNIGVLGVEFLQEGFDPVPSGMDTDPPYRVLIDPGRTYSVADFGPGVREVLIIVRDVADNTDTLLLSVNYQP